MEIDTPIAEDIHATDQAAQYDAACKRLLSQKIILAWILKSCLKEFRDCSVQEIAEKYIEGTPQVSEVAVAPDESNAPRIRGIGSEDTSLTEGSNTYDIRFRACAPGTGELIEMIIDLEAHGDFYPGYPILKRGVYYCGRMISSQNGTEFVHSEYHKIKKVVSIWICMKPPQKRWNTITRYHMTEENLVGSVKEPVENYDLIDVVMICLGGEGGANYNGVLKLLDVLLSSKAGEAKKRQVLENEFDIPMTETLESEVSQVCNLSELLIDSGREEGRVEGRVEGREEGRVEGREEGRSEGFLASIRSLVASMGWSVEQAMDALRLSDNDRAKCVELLQKQ